MARPLTLADGQVGTTAATLLSGADAPPTGRVDVVLQNTTSAVQTVVLTYTRAGGTARRLARFVLEENQQAVYRGVPLQPDDTLLGVTTTASVVDYLIFASDAKTLSSETYTADGAGKGVDALRKLLFGSELSHGTELPDPGA